MCIQIKFYNKNENKFATVLQSKLEESGRITTIAILTRFSKT